MESFWATLKREIAHIRRSHGIWFDSRDAARRYLFDLIEVLGQDPLSGRARPRGVRAAFD